MLFLLFVLGSITPVGLLYCALRRCLNAVCVLIFSLGSFTGWLFGIMLVNGREWVGPLLWAAVVGPFCVEIYRTLVPDRPVPRQAPGVGMTPPAK